MVNITYRKIRPYAFCKKDVYRNFTKFTGKHLCQSLFFTLNFIKKETLAQVFSCKFFKISKNTFSYRTPQMAATVLGLYLFITHPCIFNIFHQIVLKRSPFIFCQLIQTGKVEHWIRVYSS